MSSDHTEVRSWTWTGLHKDTRTRPHAQRKTHFENTHSHMLCVQSVGWGMEEVESERVCASEWRETEKHNLSTTEAADPGLQPGPGPRPGPGSGSSVSCSGFSLLIWQTHLWADSDFKGITSDFWPLPLVALHQGGDCCHHLHLYWLLLFIYLLKCEIYI